MKRLSLAICSLLLLMTASASATVTMRIQPTVGPNIHRTGYWKAFTENTTKALADGTTEIGDPQATPGAFNAVSDIHLGQAISTNFVSWEGFASPGGKFAGEGGSRLHFSILILGNGTKFRLSDLSFASDSTDPNNVLDYETELSTTNYAAHRIGIDYGPDGKRYTNDDIIYKANESGDKLIDELQYVGVGIALECTNKSEGANPSAKLDNTIKAAGTGSKTFKITGAYTLKSPTGADLASASQTVNVTPRPTAMPAYLKPQTTASAGAPASSSGSTSAGDGKSKESPLALLLGPGAAILLLAIFFGVRWFIRRRRYVPLASHRNPPA